MIGKYNDDTTSRPTADDAGCWIDGHWGQYGVARMIQLAAAFGYSDRAPVETPAETLARMHLASMGPSESPSLTQAQYEDMMWAADAVELWLNENVAPEGFSFGWHDGEFFLWSDETWDEESS